MTEQRQQPSIGRIVHVPMDPESNNGLSFAAAIVTRVWDASMVNVTVFPDSPVSGTIQRTSITRVEELPERFTNRQDGVQNNVWCWPPRV